MSCHKTPAASVQSAVFPPPRALVATARYSKSYKVNTAAGPLNTCIDTLYQPLSEYTLEYMYYNTFHPDGHTTPTWRSNLCPRTPLTLFGHEL